jgi:hypothetical protein
VQFEAHPDSKQSPIPSRSRPIMQLRVIELLTPVVQVGEIEVIEHPEPGKLHSVLKNGRYVPWTYAPQGLVRRSFSRAIELSKRSVVSNHRTYLSMTYSFFMSARRIFSATAMAPDVQCLLWASL